MFWKVILALILLCLLIWAVRTKCFIKRSRSEKMPTSGAIDSPASLAMGEIVAVAGGIYLSLILIASFLKLDYPDSVVIFSMALDPLALAAIVLALIQPIFMSFYYRLK